MDELANQLRRLGEATESEVSPVTAQEATATAGSQVIHLDNAALGAPGNPLVRRKRSGRRLLAAAAAIVVLAIASIALTMRGSEEAALETAGQPAPNGVVIFDDNGWEDLRQCESNGDYRVDTGNSFYGAYQFARSYWDDTAAAAGLDAYVGTNPAQAPPPVQDALAATLFLSDGADPWPVCGRFLTGPMNTPIIPQWLPEPADSGSGTIIVLARGLTDTELSETFELVGEIVAGERGVFPGFVTQAQHLEEFLEVFEDNPEIADGVVEADLPTSIRLDGPGVADIDLDRFRELPNVVDVIETSPPTVFEGVGHRLVIPSIGIDVPVFTEPTVSNLANGVALHAPRLERPDPDVPVELTSSFREPSQTTTVIAGYGTGVTNAPFGRLAELQPGETVEFHTLLDLINHEVRVEKYLVTGAVTSPGSEPPWSVLSSFEVIPSEDAILLVTNGREPGERLVYMAVPLPVDPAPFGVDLGG